MTATQRGRTARNRGNQEDEMAGDTWRPRSGRVVFLDTETTGLDPDMEAVFEIAAITEGEERVWRVRPDDRFVNQMHPKAAEVNRYHERTARDLWRWDPPLVVARELRGVLDGAHIVGAVPDFDARHITAFYRRVGQSPPRWHYHLIDIENLAYGWLLRQPLTAEDRAVVTSLPWDSQRLSRLCGIEPPADDERHTALGDARWCVRWWNRLHTLEGGEDAT